MPNWCESDLFVNGDAEKIKEFQEFAKGENDMLLDMDKFIPYPEKFKEMDKISEDWEKTHKLSADNFKDRPTDGYNAGGYDWCVDNWGTKWNFCETEIDEEYNWDGVKYTFQTAWSPPTPVILAMSEKFPDLEFDLRYFEQGAGFNGIYKVKAGEVLDDKTGDYFGNRGG